MALQFERVDAREVDRDGRAQTRAAGDTDHPSMRFHDPQANGQAQAGSSPAARPGLVGSIEALEDVRKMVRRDPDTAVANGHHGRFTVRPGRYDDTALRRRVVDAVVDEIDEQPR